MRCGYSSTASSRPNRRTTFWSTKFRFCTQDTGIHFTATSQPWSMVKSQYHAHSRGKLIMDWATYCETKYDARAEIFESPQRLKELQSEILQDRLYSLFDFSKPYDALTLPIDYKCSDLNVYHHIDMCIFRGTVSLDLLLACEQRLWLGYLTCIPDGDEGVASKGFILLLFRGHRSKVSETGYGRLGMEDWQVSVHHRRFARRPTVFKPALSL
jgi:hypothetical protein